MQIYKFGGASVKDADGVKNVALLLNELEAKNTIIVISAMGKTTNALEEVVHNYFNDTDALNESIQKNVAFHHTIASQLFPPGHLVFKKTQDLFTELKGFIARNKSPQYDFVYD